jgi:hypothetical protein
VRFHEFSEAIQATLNQHPDGLTWEQLRDRANLPYERYCPEWTRRLEQELGLRRTRIAGRGRALIWAIPEGGK